MRCEVAAWQKAMTLVRFTPAMFGEVKRGLGSYRHTTPAPQSAVDALDSQCSSLAYAEHRQDFVRRSLDFKRAEREWRCLTDQQRFDRRIAMQRAEVERMRARRARKG